MKDKLFKIGYRSLFTVICIVVVIVMIIAISSGCGNRTVDTNYKFNYVVINRLDGTTIEGQIKSWNTYGNSAMVQVTFSDGTVYYTHGSNVIFIYKE